MYLLKPCLDSSSHVTVASSGESGTNSVIGSTQGPVTSLRIARAHLSADNARCPKAAERAYFKDPVSSYGKMIAELAPTARDHRSLGPSKGLK